MTDQFIAPTPAIQPLLVVRDAVAAIQFYTSVFGATERWRLMHYHRVGHAILRFGSSDMALLDEFPEVGIVGPADADSTQRREARLMLQVEDVDAVLRKAADAGATVVRPAEDQWWGVRSGSIRDPFGHQWSLFTLTEAISIEEMQRRADELGLYPPPEGDAAD